MKKLISFLFLMLSIAIVHGQSFEEFFNNNSINGSLKKKYYSESANHQPYAHARSIKINLSHQNLVDLKGISSIKIDNQPITQFKFISLNLSFNNLTVLPDEIASLNLKQLSVRNNKLTDLDESIGKLTHLKDLNLNYNKLKSLPHTISTLSNLKKLYINNNKLTSIPDEIGTLTQLSNLDLNNNKLEYLPTTINKLINLNNLNMSSNKLKSLPSITQLVKLTTLNLNNNKLTHLPSDITTFAVKVYQTAYPHHANTLHYKYYPKPPLTINLCNNPLMGISRSLYQVHQHKKAILNLQDTPAGYILACLQYKTTGISDPNFHPVLISTFYKYSSLNSDNIMPVSIIGAKNVNSNTPSKGFLKNILNNVYNLVQSKVIQKKTNNPIEKKYINEDLIRKIYSYYSLTN